MPRVTAWLVRASLLYLVGGFLLGALLLAAKGMQWGSWIWAFRGVHIEMLLVGWMIQLVMGVAIWIFPRFVLHRAPRRSAVTAWLAFALLNSGIILVCVGGVGGGGGGGGELLVAGRLVEIGAALSCAVHLWGRVSPAGLSAM